MSLQLLLLWISNGISFPFLFQPCFYISMCNNYISNLNNQFDKHCAFHLLVFDFLICFSFIFGFLKIFRFNKLLATINAWNIFLVFVHACLSYKMNNNIVANERAVMRWAAYISLNIKYLIWNIFLFSFVLLVNANREKDYAISLR